MNIFKSKAPHVPVAKSKFFEEQNLRLPADVLIEDRTYIARLICPVNPAPLAERDDARFAADFEVILPGIEPVRTHRLGRVIYGKIALQPLGINQQPLDVIDERAIEPTGLVFTQERIYPSKFADDYVNRVSGYLLSSLEYHDIMGACIPEEEKIPTLA